VNRGKEGGREGVYMCVCEREKIRRVYFPVCVN